MTIRSLISLCLFCILMVAGLHPTLTQAQSEKKDCKPADVITKAAALKTAGDTTADMKALLVLQNEIQKANIACNGFIFKKTGNGVIGPFDLPEGTFKVTVKTSSATVIGDLKVLKGICKGSNTMTSLGKLFYVINTDAMMGNGPEREEEALLESGGCRATIQITSVTKPYTLTIEPIE